MRSHVNQDYECAIFCSNAKYLFTEAPESMHARISAIKIPDALKISNHVTYKHA
jgi:hypothetical protein